MCFVGTEKRYMANLFELWDTSSLVFFTHPFFLSMTHVYKHCSLVIAVKRIMWHVQENLAPQRWWKLGKSLEEYIHAFGCVSTWIFWVLTWKTLCDWFVVMSARFGFMLNVTSHATTCRLFSYLLYDDIFYVLFCFDINMQLFYEYLLLIWHCVCLVWLNAAARLWPGWMPGLGPCSHPWACSANWESHALAFVD